MKYPAKLLIGGTTIFLIIITGIFFIYRSQKPSTYTQSSSTIIKQLQTIGRLETASYSIETIIEAGTTPGTPFSNLLFSDKILLIAHGQVIAGFDLSQLNQDNIDIQNNNLTLTLPPPQILSVSLDNTKTRVYDRQQGLLTAGNKDLESQARLAAEDQIRQAACQDDILTQASQSARDQLTLLLSNYFQSVTITIPSASC